MARVPDLLKAAAVLARRSAAQIAQETGIRRSRVERLLSARAAPRGDEAERITAACDVNPRLVTTPAAFALVGDVVRLRRGVGGLLPTSTVLGLLLNRDPESPSQHALDDCRLSIDKLWLTFDVTNVGKLLALGNRLGQSTQTRDAAYAHEFWIRRVLLQHGKPQQGQQAARTSRYRRRRSSRVTFNPAFASKRELSAVRRVLALAEPSAIRISRLDIAVDVPGSIRRWQAIASRRPKVNVHLGPQGVETIYIGRSGDVPFAAETGVAADG